MKLNNKIIILIYIIVLIVIILVGLFFLKRNTSSKNDDLMDNAYIDIWKEKSDDMDIALYSSGSGKNEKLYLGKQPLHYIISKKGDIYTYQASSFKNKMTDKMDPPTSEYIKTLSKSDFKRIESELNSIVENNSNSSKSSYGSWHVKMNGKTTIVNVNLQTQILDKYL